MTLKNLYLNPTTHDLEVQNFQLRETSNITEWLSQKIENRFKTFKGELFTDYTIGFPYFQKVLKKHKNLNEVTSLFKNYLKKIEGVSSIIKFEVEFDNANRKFNVTFEVKATTGEIVEGSFST